ncbi:MAG TPA: YetF domain-containing protein [Fimbriimonas sp.]
METVLRVLVIYLFVLIGMRLIGKREFGQLAPHEFVILLIIPEVVSTTLNQNDTSITNAIVGVATILVLVFTTSMLTHRFQAAEKIVSDTATVLVHKGKLFKQVLDKERVTPDEILDEARKSGLDTLDKVKWAILQPDGKIAIVPVEGESSNQPPESGKPG